MQIIEERRKRRRAQASARFSGSVVVLLAALVALTACNGPTSGPPALAPPVGPEVSVGLPTQDPLVPGGTTGLGIVGIYTRDLTASLAFYRRLGLDVPATPDPQAQDYRLRLPTGQVLFWETWTYTRNALGRPYHPEPAIVELRSNSASPPRMTSPACTRRSCRPAADPTFHPRTGRDRSATPWSSTRTAIRSVSAGPSRPDRFT